MATSTSPSDSISPAEGPPTTRDFETLPVLPLPDGVILPDTVVTISLQSEEATAVVQAASTTKRLLLVPRFERDEGTRFARVGVIATIEDTGQLPDGTPAITIKAHQRARVGTGVIGASAGLWVEAEPVSDTSTSETAALASEYRAAAGALLERVGGRRMAGVLRELTTASALADSVAYWPELGNERRITLLETIDVDRRLRLATVWVKEAIAEVEMRERIQNEVTGDLEKTQRDAILRRQMSAIRKELGEGDSDIVSEFRTKLSEVEGSMPAATVKAITTEIDRLDRTGTESMESNWIRTWLDTVFDVPWNERSEENLDLIEARAILDADHTGLDDVKDRLVEHLAVRKLRHDRGVENELTEVGSGRRRAVILALVGPPGVGKTSLGESVARALGRQFVRLALGGLRDEAEIRGHRRTYVGARPGRLVRALTEAGSMNPVVLLDELDKVSGGYQGDPAAALLEVLDPAQNHSFRDHYLEFELDLSDVVFIATANVLDTIPGPLLDRLEIITLDGYTESEKATIAVDHLLPRLVRQNGLRDGEVVITQATIRSIASDYTREAGVRRLERLLDKTLRKSLTRIATEGVDRTEPIVIAPEDLRELLGRPIPSEEVEHRIDRPGIATGLAVTGAGGDVLFVEMALVPGEGEPVLTGQLGDVMKESAAIARSVVSAHADRLGVTMPAGQRLHVHFPAGGVPKDGPSAGITMTTALVSLLSGRTVRPELAMTGEVTLQGRVLPIGGAKQKILAAYRAGLREVILPKDNEHDLEDVPAEVLDHITVHLARDIDQVLGWALA
ncbi:MAG: endopeptidase La [Acidimicrobiales bacterium]|nr:endopeptidase La [Acidimicrobiales bacterium]